MLDIYLEETRTERLMYLNVHWNTIYSSYDMEATEMSISRRIWKLWYIDTKEYYSAIKKECIWVSSNVVDEPRTYYTEWNKSEKHQYSILMHTYGI